MGYELKKLMKMYGVSTPTMAPAPQMPGAAPTALAEGATAEQQAKYAADKAAFDESMRKYGLNQAQYDQYARDYQNRLANTNMYNQAQFSTTGANVPAFTTYSDAQKAALGYGPAVTPTVGAPTAGAPTVGEGEAALPVMPQPGPDASNPNPVVNPLRVLAGETKTQYLERVKGMGAPGRGQNAPPGMMFGPNDALVPDPNYGGTIMPMPQPGPQDFTGIGQGGLNQQIQNYMGTNPSMPDLNAYMTRYGITDYDMRNAMGTGTTYGAPQWTDMLKSPVYGAPITTMPVDTGGTTMPVDTGGTTGTTGTTTDGTIGTTTGGSGRNRDGERDDMREIGRPGNGTGTGSFGLPDPFGGGSRTTSGGYTGLRDMFDGGGPGRSGTRGGYTSLRDMFDGGGPGRSRAKAEGGYIQNYAEGGTVQGYAPGGIVYGGAGDDVLMGRPADDMLTPAPAPVAEDPQDPLMAMYERYALPVDRSAEIAAATERRAAEQKTLEELLMKQLDVQDNAPQSKAEMYLRLAAAFGAPTKTGHFSENLALVGQTMADELAARSKREREDRANRLGIQTELQKMRLDAAGEALAVEQGLQERETEYGRELYKESLKDSEGKFRRATKAEAAAYGAEGGQFGPDGRFYAVDVPQGMTIESDGAGGFRLIQGPGGGKSDKPPTEGQLAGAGYLQRMTKAEAILRDLERTEEVVTIPLEKTLLMGTGAEGYVLNSTEQRVAQAQRDWVRAKLRKESGAVIGAEEMAEEIKTYFPQPGESPETIAQKAASRRSAEEQMRITSGTAAEQAGEISPEYAPPIRADELARAGIGRGPAPQPVVIDGVAPPEVGTIDNGYRFKGGNPADPNNWEKV